MAVKKYKFLPGVSSLSHKHGVINRPVDGIVFLEEIYFDQYVGTVLEKAAEPAPAPAASVIPSAPAPAPKAAPKVEEKKEEKKSIAKDIKKKFRR